MRVSDRLGDSSATDSVWLPLPLVEWLIGRALASFRAGGATSSDYARLEAVREHKRAAAFASGRSLAGPIRDGWCTLAEVADATGEPVRTWQARAKSGRFNGEPVRAEKLSGWYLWSADTTRRNIHVR